MLTRPGVSQVKRIIGRRLSDPGVQATVDQFPYKVSEKVLRTKKGNPDPTLYVEMPSAPSLMTPQDPPSQP
jgi:hypothetical protein